MNNLIELPLCPLCASNKRSFVFRVDDCSELNQKFDLVRCQICSIYRNLLYRTAKFRLIRRKFGIFNLYSLRIHLFSMLLLSGYILLLPLSYTRLGRKMGIYLIIHGRK